MPRIGQEITFLIHVVQPLQTTRRSSKRIPSYAAGAATVKRQGAVMAMRALLNRMVLAHVSAPCAIGVWVCCEVQP